MGFVSLGCAKNLVDSEFMAGFLRAAGHELASSPEAADVVVVNTCAFIRAAKEESIAAILDACRLKERGRCGGVIVTGCLPQRYGSDLVRALPEVDAFLGVGELRRIGDLVRRVHGGARGLVRVSAPCRHLVEPVLPRVLFTGGVYAYVKVSDGCHHRCRFCAIPRIRGRYRSRPVRAVVREAEHLLENGVRELNLVSQDLTSYGRDLGGGQDLVRLLRELGRIGGKFWIRLLYGHPALVTAELLDAVASIPQVCKYLDLPIQHSHPEMLRAMGREGDPGELAGLPWRIREAVPGVALRTTCLVGYPGERARHFGHLSDFVKRAAFDHLGVFVYSPEEGTPACRLPGRPGGAVAGRRRARLLGVQREVAAASNEKRIGKTVEVLIEDSGAGGAGRCVSRSQREAPEVDGVVYVRWPSNERRTARPRPGDFVRVVLERRAGYDMWGRL